jgi:glycosyltransferase involved in cell wall biosynthesis
MKIVFLTDDFPPFSRGGAGAVAFRLAKGLMTAGHEVNVITSTQEKAAESESFYEGLKVFKIHSQNSGVFRFWRGIYNSQVTKRIARILFEIKPDVVHAHAINSQLSWWALVTARKYAKKVFLTIHDVGPFAYSRLTHFIDKTGATCPQNPDYRMTFLRQLKQAKKKFVPLRTQIIKFILKKYVDKIFSVSNELKLALNQNGFKNVTVVYNSADPRFFDISEKEIQKFKIEHELLGRKTILIGGRLMGSKGIGQMLEAMALVSEEYKDVILWIVGEGGGKYDAGLTKNIKDLGLENFVRHEKWMSENLFEIAVASIDIIAVPSVCFDSFPTMALDGSTTGKPVIATCFGGAKEIVEDGKSGFVLNPYNIKKMAEKILFILNNEDEAKKMGVAGRDIVRGKFMINKQINRLLEFYD